MNTSKIVKNLKENEQDFEWYPTTEEIIKDLFLDINSNKNNISKRNSYDFSILDIGAGNGKVFSILDKYINEYYPFDENGYKPNGSIFFKKYAIEKSQILIEQMEKDIYIVGTDFKDQTLIDKKMDIIFCNPPYSQFENWIEKIIKESYSRYIYLVIPERWENEKNKKIIKERDFEYKIIGNYDFLNSEDRSARAKVHLVKIYRSKYIENDPFSTWFDSFFSINAEKEKDYKTSVGKEKIKNSLVAGENKIIALENLYKNELEKLLNNYKSFEKLDFEIFKELKVDIESLKESLKLKISGLKNKYWEILFENLEVLTKKLIKKNRKKLLEKLTEQTNIDFTSSNVYSIIIWAIKNSNEYLDEQLKKIFFDFVSDENVKRYKSNKKTWDKEDWRYKKEKNISHVALEYRIVMHGYNSFATSFYNQRTNCNLNENCLDKIKDLFTIANLLNFYIIEDPEKILWEPGQKTFFNYKDIDDNINLFCEIKIFKNGNIHYKFCQKFIRKFNVEIAKLLKWVKNPQEASEEFDISLKEASLIFKENYHISLKNNILLK